MEVRKLIVSRKKAGELYRKYKEHANYQTPMDAGIQRVYQLIGQGRVVIQALASIGQAGLNEAGLPCLAIARADQRWCHVELWQNGAAKFAHESWASRESRTKVLRLPEGALPRRASHDRAEAMVPIIPVHLRPKRGLPNYHILWEAEWSARAPVDPYLLRRITGDMWLVVAAWDLTPVERAAMSTGLAS